MVKNSLLDAYRELNRLRRKLYEGQYYEKLKKRLDFYEQEGMTKEYYQAYRALQEYEQIGYELDHVFVKPGESYMGEKFSWQEYYRRADQLLYGEPCPENANPDYYGTNDKLLSIAVEELNKKYPSDKWQLGDLPLYRWNILNYPGYETTPADIQYWRSNPNVTESNGYFIEASVRHVKCIHSAGAKSILTHAQDDIKKLRSACSAIKEAREAYVVEDDVLLDHECSGGYDLGLDIVFSDNATTTFYGTALTPQEQILNSTIVREIDTRLAGSKDMAIVHERLNRISSDFISFLANNKFKLSTSEAAPASAEEDTLSR